MKNKQLDDIEQAAYQLAKLDGVEMVDIDTDDFWAGEPYLHIHLQIDEDLHNLVMAEQTAAYQESQDPLAGTPLGELFEQLKKEAHES